jgi:phage terminase large subunit GpA-like protein
MGSLADIRRNALRSLIPPPRLHLSEWIEQNIRLPEGVSALPGAIRHYPYHARSPMRSAIPKSSASPW